MLATDARSNATQIAFDALDRVAGTVDPLSGKTATGYDGQDNPTSHIDKIGVQTTFTRDGFGEVIQEASPDRGTSSYVYNSGGDLVQTTDGRGQVINFTRDILGRLTARTPVGVTGQNVSYVYDTTYVGKLASMADVSGSTAFTYDARGNVLKRVSTIVKTAHTLSYTYDAADRVLSVTYPSGRVVTYQRDARGRVSAVNLQASAGAASVGLVSNIVYDAFGPLTSMALGNGLTVTQNFGSDDRLYSRALTGGSGALWSKAYAYDNDDNITAITDSLTPAKTLGLSYDALSRLTEATGYFAAGTREDFSYDANGNRLELDTRLLATDANPKLKAVSTLVPGTNRLDHVVLSTGTRQLSYDGRGNVLQETRPPSGKLPTTLPYTYDAYGRLVAVPQTQTTQFTMLYNGFDQRVQLSVNAVPRREVYDGSGRLIGEYGSSLSTVYAEHVWLDPDAGEGDGWQPLALLGAAGSPVYWVMGDHLGTPAVITGASGTVVNTYDAEPFGQRWKSTTSTPTTTLAQPGQIVDAADRYYNMYRDYDPTLGRYLEADPIGLGGGENVFAYSHNTPQHFIDTLGLDAYVQNTTAVFGLHQNISVDTPTGPYRQSFGLNNGGGLLDSNSPGASFDDPGPGNPGEGAVYADTTSVATGDFERLKTTPIEDALIKAYLQKQLGNTGKYNALGNSCRNYSQNQFDKISQMIQNYRNGRGFK